MILTTIFSCRDGFVEPEYFGSVQAEILLADDFSPIESHDKSRQFVVRFPEFVAWQVVDESFTSWDDYEQRDDFGTVQALSRSKYLDYVKGSHGWFQDTVGPAQHYRVWTVVDVVDVVACKPPTVERWAAP